MGTPLSGESAGDSSYSAVRVMAVYKCRPGEAGLLIRACSVSEKLSSYVFMIGELLEA